MLFRSVDATYPLAIGDVTLTRVYDSLERRENGDFGFGWSLFPAAQGKGYATEAAARVMRWAADDLALPPLFSFVHPDNAASRRLAERLGAVLTGDTEFRGQPRLIYRHRDLQTSNINLSNQPEKALTCQS